MSDDLLEKSDDKYYNLPNNLRGRSIHSKVIPTVCNLENMLDKWKQAIRKHILDGEPSGLGASCIDIYIYLVGYVSENYGKGKLSFFEYIKKNNISDKDNSAQAICQVGKGDGVYLGILNDDGTISDWDFIKEWLRVSK